MICCEGSTLTRPAVLTFALAEELSAIFTPSSFDLAHSGNAIDHSKDVLKAIEEMIRVVKPRCYVFLNHKIREGRREAHAQKPSMGPLPKERQVLCGTARAGAKKVQGKWVIAWVANQAGRTLITAQGNCFQLLQNDLTRQPA